MLTERCSLLKFQIGFRGVMRSMQKQPRSARPTGQARVPPNFRLHRLLVSESVTCNAVVVFGKRFSQTAIPIRQYSARQTASALARFVASSPAARDDLRSSSSSIGPTHCVFDRFQGSTTPFVHWNSHREPRLARAVSAHFHRNRSARLVS